MRIELDCARPAFVKVLPVFTTIVADTIVTVMNGTLTVRLFQWYVALFAHTHLSTHCVSLCTHTLVNT
jgi:hypothetical protein